MGNFNLSIRGVGSHHNGLPHDVERQGARFVGYMRAAGHGVSGAEVTTGGATQLAGDGEVLSVSPLERDALVEAHAAEAFDAYNRCGPNPGKTHDGKDVPPWERLGDQVQAKWRAAAKALMGLPALLLVLLLAAPSSAETCEQLRGGCATSALAAEAGRQAFAATAQALRSDELRAATWVDGPTISAAEPVDTLPPQPPVSPVVKLVVDHLFELIVTSLLPALFLWVRAHTKGTVLENSVDVFERAVKSTVAVARDKIQAALEDGVISESEKADIVATILRELPATVLKPIQQAFGDGFGTYLMGLAIGFVKDEQHKAAKAAGDAAAAAIPDVDAAIAAERARRSRPETGL